jgi:autotransporter-associated beta strand protein
MFGTRYYCAATRGIGGKRLRAALLASSALALAWTLPATPSRAQDATWQTNPGSGDFFDANNWTAGSVPTGMATFGTSSATTLTLGSSGDFGGWTLNAGASNYTFTISPSIQNFTGTGIVINGGSATITNNGSLTFLNTSTAGSASITNNGDLYFNGTSTAGNATITNNYGLFFNGTSTAGSAAITNSNFVAFYGASTAGNSTITNGINNFGIVQFYSMSTAGSATITNDNGGTTAFRDHSTAGNANITNSGGGTLYFILSSTAGNASITNAANLNFYDTARAGSAVIINSWDLHFYDWATAGSATITNDRDLNFHDNSTAGNATIVNSIFNGRMVFRDSSRAGSAIITNDYRLFFVDIATAGSANITNNGDTQFTESATAGNAFITNSNLLTFDTLATGGDAVIRNIVNTRFSGNSTPGNAQLINDGSNAVLDLSMTTGPNGDGKISAGSIAGNGIFYLGNSELTVGGNNLSTTVTGVITGTGNATGSSLIKTGAGTLTLSGTNVYTGATTVNGGTLAVDGSITSSSSVTVNNGGALGGTGTVGNTTIASGGALAPGNSIGTLTVSGNLAFSTGAAYMIEISPTAADRTNVTGTATLTGATVQAIALPGSFRSRTYTILNATGGFGGTQFARLDVINSFRPGARNPHLIYDANNVYLVLDPGEIILPSGTNANQASVAGGINRAVLGGATPPAGFDVLLNLEGTPLKNALTQIAGETATGTQQSTFNAMTMFMGQMTDPFIDGRGDVGASVQSVSSYATDGAARRAAVARDAFAAIPPAAPTRFEQRWSVWAGGYGGGQTADGNAVSGTGTATSRIYGGIGGADYRLSPDTLVGFALAGGGTSFGVTNGGSGRADLFQAGAFARHQFGAAYLTGALAYGWQDVTTDRTVTVAGIDRLQARFRANTVAGRVEGGYRFATPWMGITPYAAGQVTSFQLPAYAESVLSGTNTFALSYGAKTVTASRSELGLRTDRSWAAGDAILTLRGRAAWAHDFNPDRAISATFQTLPGASFVVNGAAQAKDAALTTAAAELKWRNGFSIGATFEGEFSAVTRSYAGKGVVRYAW